MAGEQAEDDGDFTILLKRAPVARAEALPVVELEVAVAPAEVLPADAEAPDAGALEAGAPDAGALDAGAGAPDAGPAVQAALRELARRVPLYAGFVGTDARRSIAGIIAEIDRRLAEQINLILHHTEFQQIEASWRGLRFLVLGVDTGPTLKIKMLDISKRELRRTLRKFHGTAWDQSPLFKRVYEEEFGQFGGEPYGVLIGDYEFDHRPEDVQLLAGIAQTAAAAHTPFIAAAAPSLMQMDSWAELANPRDLTRIFQTPEYTAWRSLRGTEDARYIGLCLPRFLGRLPYGAQTEPAEGFEFEEMPKVRTDGAICGPTPRTRWPPTLRGHSACIRGACGYAGSTPGARWRGCRC
jgi:type VI secretion system ImpC/EvpB family protein